MRVETRTYVIALRYGFPRHYRHLTRVPGYFGFAAYGLAGFVARKADGRSPQQERELLRELAGGYA